MPYDENLMTGDEDLNQRPNLTSSKYQEYLETSSTSMTSREKKKKPKKIKNLKGKANGT